MTLQATTATLPATLMRPTLDDLAPEAREALLDLVWAAWYSSRPESAKALLAGIDAEDPLVAARAAGATADASLKLMRLRRIAAGDIETIAIVDGLREGAPVLHVPARLRRVLAASDDERRTMLVRARGGISTMSRDGAEAVAVVLGYLVGTEIDYGAARLREVPRLRGFSRAVMGALGLPFGGYMARVRAWL